MKIASSKEPDQTDPAHEESIGLECQVRLGSAHADLRLPWAQYCIDGFHLTLVSVLETHLNCMRTSKPQSSCGITQSCQHL